MGEQLSNSDRRIARGLGLGFGILAVMFGSHYIIGLVDGGTDNLSGNDNQEETDSVTQQPALDTLPQCSQIGELDLMEPGDHDPQAPEYISYQLGHTEPVPIYSGDFSCPYGTDVGQVAVEGVKRCLAVSPLGGRGVGSNNFSGGCLEP